MEAMAKHLVQERSLHLSALANTIKAVHGIPATVQDLKACLDGRNTKYAVIDQMRFHGMDNSAIEQQFIAWGVPFARRLS